MMYELMGVRPRNVTGTRVAFSRSDWIRLWFEVGNACRDLLPEETICGALSPTSQQYIPGCVTGLMAHRLYERHGEKMPNTLRSFVAFCRTCGGFEILPKQADNVITHETGALAS